MPLVAHILFTFLFLRNAFSSFLHGSFRLIIWRLRGHKICTKPSLHSFRKSYILFLLLSEHLLQTAISQLESCNSLPGLLLPYLLFLVNPHHSTHSDSFQRKVRSHQSSTQNPSLAPQLIQSWQGSTTNSLCHFSDLTSPLSHTTSTRASLADCLLFLALPRQIPGSGHLHLHFSFPETLFSK